MVKREDKIIGVNRKNRSSVECAFLCILGRDTRLKRHKERLTEKQETL
jgi:hypothetical protein